MKTDKRKRQLIIGICFCGVKLVFMLMSLFYTPHDPNAMNVLEKFAGPSWTHPLGCDNFGRDILSRVMAGSTATLFIAIQIVLFGVIVGIIIGALAGLHGGFLDELLMRINDVLFAFPGILLALVFVSVLGGGQSTIIWALGIAFIPSYARIVRGEFLRLKKMDYISAARLSGASSLRILTHHIMPNTVAVMVPAIMIGFNNAVLAEAGMSYLGLGVQPPDPSLGRMLAEAQTYMLSAPLMALAPGTVLILVVLGFSILSDALSDVGVVNI